MNYIEKARQNRQTALRTIRARRDNMFAGLAVPANEGPRSPLFLALASRPQPAFDMIQGVA